MILGYARTSTFDQAAGLAAHQRDLKAAGATKPPADQVSSVSRRDRRNECVTYLRNGNTLMVTSRNAQPAALLAMEADLSKRGV